MNRSVVIVGLGLLCGSLAVACGEGGGASTFGGSSGEGESKAGDDISGDDDDVAEEGGESGATNSSAGLEDDSGGVVGPDGCVPGVPGTSQIPRLTNAQYDRTIRDLLGLTGLTASGNVAPSVLLATDQSGGLTDLGWSSYQSVAELISSQVMADSTLRGNFLRCAPEEAGCLHDTVITFGRRIFRRPLTEAEIARFDAFVAKGAEITPTGAPEELAEALLYAFLVSPSFLQRSEIAEDPAGDGRFRLSSHEVASRLSYLLWGSMPDDVLEHAADQGQLAAPSQILAQAERMLQDPRARDMVSDFHRYYLIMGPGGRWDTAQKDPQRFPTFTPAQVPLLAEETLRFFDHVAFTGGTFQDFLLSPVAFVNSTTAPLYGLDPAGFGSELQQTELDPAERPGFLTRAGFLAGYASFSNTAPLLRGAFITKDVIGIHIAPPPPGADQTEFPEGDFATNRERFDALTSSPDCAGCHRSFINPPGFVMEAFDAVGAWQTVDASTGAPIDMTADVIVDAKDGAVPISNPAELMQKIADSSTAQKHYAKKWVGYAYEREADPMDECIVASLSDKMTSGGYTVLDLITDLTQTESFRVRAIEVDQ